MRQQLFSTLAVIAVVVTACGGGGDGGGGRQGEVADMFIDIAAERGIELDRGCVEAAAEGLSDDDAEKIVAAGVEGNPELSEAADEVGNEMFNCVDAGSYLDSIIAQFEDDDSVDADCLRNELAGLDTPDEIDDKFVDAALACSS